MKNEKLRQALSFHTLLVGGNPMTTSAIYALIHKLETRRRRVVRRGRDQPAGRGHGRACSSGWAGRCGSAIRWRDRDAGRPRDRRHHRERLAGRGRCGRDQRRCRCTPIATCCADRAARSGRAAQAGAQALFAVAVRRPFRRQGQMAGHPAPHDPVRPALSGIARRHLRPWRAGRGFLALSPPSDRDRSDAWRPRGIRPSTRSRRCRISASSRSTGTRSAPILEKRILDEIGRG